MKKIEPFELLIFSTMMLIVYTHSTNEVISLLSGCLCFVGILSWLNKKIGW
jgi:hypothetical protein